MGNVQLYEVLSKSSQTVIVVTALVEEDERGGQGHISSSLLNQSATWPHCEHALFLHKYISTSYFVPASSLCEAR
jgi:hypothetical protein